MTQDPNRHCIYCYIDTWDPRSAHNEECPIVTGRYPVRAVGDHPSPERCLRCGAGMVVGGLYCHAPTDKQSIFEAWCIECGEREHVIEA